MQRKTLAHCSEPTEALVAAFQSYLIQQYHEKSLSWDQARSFLEKISEELTSDLPSNAESVDLLSIADRLNVSVTFRDTRQPFGGFIVPEGTGFRACIDGRPDNVRSRFTLAHELGHVFFYDLERIPLRPLFSYPMDSQYALKEEGLCHAFAARLLLPAKFFSYELKETTSMMQIMALARRRRVSSETFIRRILYGLEWLESYVFYLVTANEKQVGSVRRFVGSSVRGKGISGPALAHNLMSCHWQDLPTALRLHLGTAADVACGGACAWVKVKL